MGAASEIKWLVMDVDGTLTDGKIYMSDSGEAMKAFSVKDGYALRELLPRHGIEPVIMTGRKSRIVENRASELGVKLLFQGVGDKLAKLKALVAEHGLRLSEIAFMGDDMVDLGCVTACGSSGCPSDAAAGIAAACGFVSKRKGGDGAVRDFAEYLTGNGCSVVSEK